MRRRCGTRPERLHAFAQVRHFGAVFGGAVKRNLLDVGIADRNVEAIAERAHRFDFHLLGLMRDVARFAGFAHAVSLDRFCQDDRRLAAMFDAPLVRRVNLARVVSAALQRPDRVVAPVGDELRRFRGNARKTRRARIFRYAI